MANSQIHMHTYTHTHTTVMMQQLRLDCIKWAALGAAWRRCSQLQRQRQQAKILISAQKSQNWQMAKQRGSTQKKTLKNKKKTN